MVIGFHTFGTSFDLFGILFFVVFMVIIGGFVFVIVGGIKTWNQNNHSPRLTVPAKVVSKRMDMSHHRHASDRDMTGSHGYSTTSSTWYYATFQVDSGDRIEFSVAGSEYGLLAEGDVGQLSFQGTRFLSFDRN